MGAAGSGARGRHEFRRRRRRRSANGCAVRDRSQRRLAHAVHRSPLQTAPLWCIRAIDIETGATLWQDLLPAGGQANPMVYEIGGRQYLVIMAGGHHFMGTPPPRGLRHRLHAAATLGALLTPVNNITSMRDKIATGRRSLAPLTTLSQVTARSQATPLS